MIRWRLKALLEANGVSAYALVQQTAGRLAPNTVYSLVRAAPKRVDLESLGVIMQTLEAMTGRSLQLQDILSYEPEDKAAPRK